MSLRHLAPDLARGVMLLVIALAHAQFFATMIGGTVHVDSTLDRAVTAGNTMLVELRGYPMFAALFGYGIGQIYLRRTADGTSWPEVRSLLRRRAGWLVAFGLIHVILLFPGDILSVYGLVTLVLVGAVRLRARTVATMAAAWLPLGAVLHALSQAEAANAGTNGLPPLPLPDGFLAELLWRLGMFAVIGAGILISTVFPFLVGILAARHRILEEPERHLRLLRWVAFAGIPVGMLGGLPLALAKTGEWADYALLDGLFAGGLHQVTGYACGLGYAALIALAAARLVGRERPVTNALAALGQRSMTFYLAQSLAWAVLFSSYALHLQVTSPSLAAAVAVAVWLATLVAADQMARRGIRGPAETALRRLLYRQA
ncbi:DUF418 domain-containing protein [Nocardiopsis oceani]